MTHTVPAVITSRQSDYEHMWLVERVMFKVEEMTKLMRIFFKSPHDTHCLRINYYVQKLGGSMEFSSNE